MPLCVQFCDIYRSQTLTSESGTDVFCGGSKVRCALLKTLVPLLVPLCTGIMYLSVQLSAKHESHVSSLLCAAYGPLCDLMQACAKVEKTDSKSSEASLVGSPPCTAYTVYYQLDKILPHYRSPGVWRYFQSFRVRDPYNSGTESTLK